MTTSRLDNPVFEDIDWRSADGLRLHARHYPAADGAADRLPVVCLPGLTRNSADFDAIARTIVERGRSVYAVDLRGRGKSESASNPKTYNTRTYAQDVLGLLDHIRTPRALFIGTSLGALVTMTLASQRSEAVAAAVLNDAGPEVPKAALDRIRSYAGRSIGAMSREQALAYVTRIGTPVYPRYVTADWEAMVDKMFRIREDGLLVLDYDPAIARTANPFMLWLVRPLVWRAWRNLASRRPVLVLRGALSDLLPRELAARMAATSPNVRVVEVPDVGHAPDLSETESQTSIHTLLDEVD